MLTSPEIIALIGILAGITGSLIYLIFKAGKTYNRIENLEKKEEKIDAGFEKNDARFEKNEAIVVILREKVDILWNVQFGQARSPFVFNEFGKSILKKSKIEDIIHENYKNILNEVKKCKPRNPYQAQERLVEKIEDLAKDEKYRDDLENRAFVSNTNVYGVLFVGAMIIRDKLLKDLGFDIENIKIGKSKK